MTDPFAVVDDSKTQGDVEIHRPVVSDDPATLSPGAHWPPRDHLQRPLLADAQKGGKITAFTRVTTMSGTIADRWALEQWNKRNVVVGMITRDDLRARAVAALGCDDESERKHLLDRIADDAMEAAGSTVAASRGTALHDMCAAALRTGRIPAIEPYRADVLAFMAAIEALGLITHPTMVERHLLNTKIGVSGTTDFLAAVTETTRSIPGLECLTAGLCVIDDLKTGETMEYSWGEVAQQEASYATSDYIAEPTGQPWWRGSSPEARASQLDATRLTPINDGGPDSLKIDPMYGFVFHVPAGTGTCTVYLVNLVAGERAIGELSIPVRAYRASAKRGDLAVRIDVPGLTPVAQDPLAPRVETETILERGVAADAPLPKARRTRGTATKTATARRKAATPVVADAHSAWAVVPTPELDDEMPSHGDKVDLALAAALRPTDNAPAGATPEALAILDDLAASERRRKIREHIDAATTPDQLAALYTLHEADWTDTLTEYGMAHLAQVHA